MTDKQALGMVVRDYVTKHETTSTTRLLFTNAPVLMQSELIRLDPFQNAVPCWQVVRRPVHTNWNKATRQYDLPFTGAHLESWFDGEQMVTGSRADNRKQMKNAGG